MKQVIEYTESRGYTLIGAVQFHNPKDAYLWYVLVDKGDGEYVFWTFNTQCPGFCHGHYYQDRKEATRYFGDRIAVL